MANTNLSVSSSCPAWSARGVYRQRRRKAIALNPDIRSSAGALFSQ